MLYRNRIIDDTKTPPSADFIAQLERSLGCELPSDYRQFLENCNGGHAEYEIDITFGDGTSEPILFGALYSLEFPGSWETIPFELIQARQQPGFPPQKVLPIAQNGGGSMLFLDLREGYRIVAFVNGLPAWTGLRQQDSLVLVADTFNAYLNALYVSDDTIVDAITNFDPKYNVPEMMAEFFDTGSPNWRVSHVEIWDRHVVNRDRG